MAGTAAKFIQIVKKFPCLYDSNLARISLLDNIIMNEGKCMLLIRFVGALLCNQHNTFFKLFSEATHRGQCVRQRFAAHGHNWDMNPELLSYWNNTLPIELIRPKYIWSS